MLFVFLDFNFNSGSVSIGLIPDFLGYIIMINGLNELLEKGNRFSKAKSYANIMAIYTGILYVMDIVGISFAIGRYVCFGLGLISTAISLYISYNIVIGIMDMEKDEGCELNSVSLYTNWKLLAVFSIATYILILIPVLAILGMIGGFIVAICFLVSFSKSKNLYYSTHV